MPELEQESRQEETRWFPQGTVIHVNGLPMRLTEHSRITAYAGNWKLFDEAGRAAHDAMAGPEFAEVARKCR